MNGDWYYRAAGKVMGPLSGEQMRQAALSLVVRPDTAVRRGLQGRWLLASEVPEFAPYLRATRPAVVAPARVAVPSSGPQRRQGANQPSQLPPPIPAADAAPHPPGALDWDKLLPIVGVGAAGFGFALLMALFIVSQMWRPEAAASRSAPATSSTVADAPAIKSSSPPPASMPAAPAESTAPAVPTAGENPMPSAGGRLDAAAVVAKVEPSVVVIRTDSRLGSGFVVDERGTVATNFHVVAGARAITLEFVDGTRVFDVGYVALTPKKDLALLRVRNFNSIKDRMRPLLLRPDVPKKGEDALAIGAPQGLEFTVSQGIVSAIRTRDEAFASRLAGGPTWVQFTCPISPGNSGGPVVDREGRVIAVVTQSRRNAQNLNLGVSCGDLIEVIESAAEQIQPLPIADSPVKSTEPKFVNIDPLHRKDWLSAIRKIEVHVISEKPGASPAGMLMSALCQALSAEGIDTRPFTALDPADPDISVGKLAIAGTIEESDGFRNWKVTLALFQARRNPSDEVEIGLTWEEDVTLPAANANERALSGRVANIAARLAAEIEIARSAPAP